MPAASSDLRKELNGAEEDGPEHDARIFGEVTDLFLSNVGRLGDSQIAAVDGVLAHLIARVEAATGDPAQRGPRQHRPGPAPDDPPACVPRTAPGGRAVLRSSSCLSEADLLEIVQKAVASSICWRSATERRSTKR